MAALYKQAALLVPAMIAATVSAQVARQPVPRENPVLWVDGTDYPPAVLRAGVSGRVKVSLAVDAEGRITDCRVAETSGVPALDARTCVVIAQRGRFYPALDSQGRPIAGTFALPVRWALPGSAPLVVDLSHGPRQTVGATEVSIGANGLIRDCRSIGTPPRAPTDLCAASPAGSRSAIRFVRDGKPVAARVRTEVSTTQDVDPAP